MRAYPVPTDISASTVGWRFRSPSGRSTPTTKAAACLQRSRYYGVYSIFPLLLVFVSVLGFALHAHPKLERSIVDSALGQFPVVGHQLQTHSLSGSSLALAIGLVGSFWAGMRVFLAGERVMNQIWGIPPVAQPSFLRARARALALLLAVGLSVLVATGLAGLGTIGLGFGIIWKLAPSRCPPGSSVGLFWFAFWISMRDSTWRHLRGGAIAAGLATRPCSWPVASTSTTNSRSQRHVRHIRPRDRLAVVALPRRARGHPRRRRQRRRHEATRPQPVPSEPRTTNQSRRRGPASPRGCGETSIG